jgi:hypothetical protein
MPQYRVNYDATTGALIAFSEIVDGRVLPSFDGSPFITVDAADTTMYSTHKVDIATATLVPDPNRGAALAALASANKAASVSASASLAGGKTLEQRVTDLEAQVAALTPAAPAPAA